jgi:hypothetical protein
MCDGSLTPFGGVKTTESGAGEHRNAAEEAASLVLVQDIDGRLPLDLGPLGMHLGGVTVEFARSGCYEGQDVGSRWVMIDVGFSAPWTSMDGSIAGCG